jgi:SAM-dependent methyltransferase
MNDKRNLFEKFEVTKEYRRLKYHVNCNLIQFFEKNVFKGKESLKVAEIACGSGFGSHLIGKQPNVGLSIASDINLSLFNQSRNSEFAAHFVIADIFSPPFRVDSFDLVWNSSSLEHFDVPQDALIQMVQVVKPGGFVFVGVPDLLGPLGIYYLTPLKKWRDWLGQPYTCKEIENMFTACKLKIKKRFTYFYRFLLEC